MLTDGRVTGLPLVDYAATKAVIEALTLTAADAGARAYATDTDEIGAYDGAAWAWMAVADYLTAAEHTAIGDSSPHHARYADSEAVSAMGAKADLNPLNHDRYTDGEALTQANAAVATHVGASDPHTQYQKESEKGAASGYASLDASVLVPAAQLPAATESAAGAAELATVAEVKAGVDTTRIVTAAGLAGIITLASPASDGKVIKSGAGVLTLAAAGDYTLTVPATGTVALLATENLFTAKQRALVTVTNPASFVGIEAANAVTVTADIDVNTRALRGYVNLNVVTGKTLGTANAQMGVQSYVEINASNAGTVSRIYNQFAYCNILAGAAGAITTYRGILHQLQFANPNTLAITDFYGITLNALATLSGGSITNAYQLYIGDITAGGTLNYAIYTNAGLVRFGGNTLIGTSTDGMTANGSLAIAQDLAHRGTYVGFYNTTPIVKQTGCAVPTDLATCIAAITALRTALNNYGLTTVV